MDNTKLPINKYKFAPVIVFGYNRAAHISECLNALNECLLADLTDLYIYVDGPKKESEQINVQAVKDVVLEFEQKSNFKSINYSFKDKNFGLAKSIIGGVSEIIEKYGKVIVVEDDLVVNTFFLKFLNEALEYYQCNSKVWSISGFNYDLECMKKYTKDVFFFYRGSSLGWGTWKDRWDTVDWECKKYNTILYRLYYKWRFTLGGCDLPGMLEQQMNGKIDSWAVRWCFDQSTKGLITVYPRKSLLKNIGFDGTGIHSGEDLFKCTISYDFGEAVNFCKPYMKHRINEEFRRTDGFSYPTYFKMFVKKIIRKG